MGALPTDGQVTIAVLPEAQQAHRDRAWMESIQDNIRTMIKFVGDWGKKTH